MIQDIISKIEVKSKNILFKEMHKYRSNTESVVPCEETIATVDEHPDKFFLIHKNLVFGNSGSISDSFYSVFSFDERGDFIKKEDASELGRLFFANIKTVAVI